MSDVPISVSWVDVPAIRKKIGQNQEITVNNQTTTDNFQKSLVVKNSNNLEKVNDFFNNDENVNSVKQKPITTIKSPNPTHDNFIQFEDNTNIEAYNNNNEKENPQPVVKKPVNLLKEDNSETKSTDNKLYIKIGLGIVAFIGFMAQLKK